MTSPRDNSSLRLLVLAPNWLGDVVMHTPLLTLLHETRSAILEQTGRRLHVCLGIRPVWAELFRNDPRIDEMMIVERGGGLGIIQETLRLATRLKAAGLDAVILGPPSFRSALLARLAGIPCRVGYRSDGRSPFLSVGLPTLVRGERHYSGEMVDLGRAWLASVGVADSAGPAVVPTTSLPGCDVIRPSGLGSGATFWAVAPGTTYGEAKTWPLGHVGDFVARAVREEGVRVVMLGDSAAAGFAGKIREGFPGSWGDDPDGSTDVVDLTGKTDLTAAVGILKSAAAFIGNDSGLMHVAAALGRPTVGIFGSSNPDWTSPVGTRARAVVPEGFSCRPCYRKTCNQPEFCLDTIGAGLVVDTVRGLVARGVLREGE